MPNIQLPSVATASISIPSSGRILFSDDANSGKMSVLTASGSVIDLESGGLGAGGADIIVKDEGSLLTSAATEFDFTGAGVNATNVGDVITVNIPGDGITEVTTNTIDFSSRKVFYSDTSPTTGTMSASFTSAELGTVQKVYHNDTSLGLDGTATWVLMGDGVYFGSTLNLIYFEWTGGTRVEYWIVQPQ